MNIGAKKADDSVEELKKINEQAGCSNFEHQPKSVTNVNVEDDTLIGVFMRQALKEEQIIQRLLAAVRCNDKDAVFNIAKEFDHEQ